MTSSAPTHSRFTRSRFNFLTKDIRAKLEQYHKNNNYIGITVKPNAKKCPFHGFVDPSIRGAVSELDLYDGYKSSGENEIPETGIYKILGFFTDWDTIRVEGKAPKFIKKPTVQLQDTNGEIYCIHEKDIKSFFIPKESLALGRRKTKKRNSNKKSKKSKKYKKSKKSKKSKTKKSKVAN